MSDNKEPGRKLGIYIHIPFCVSKCRYCDFLSMPCDSAVRKAYVNALIGEITRDAERFCDYRVDTIFIGGGTPSVLEGEQIETILGAVRDNYQLEPYTECTIECNPGTVTYAKAYKWLNSGVNRLSIGLQSANNDELRFLGRIHTAEDFVESFYMARSCGYTNINIDLMNALPYQSVTSFCDTLRSVTGLNPEHLSVYSLIVEENTPLYDWVNAGNEDSLCCEEDERQMYYLTSQILSEYGYERYEISNYARRGYECRHNLGYWERKEYAGFGLGAASLVGDTRYNNVSDMDEYIRSCGNVKVNTEKLSVNDEMAEFMFLGLRKIKGISKKSFFDCFGVSYDKIYKTVTEKLVSKGLIIDSEDTVQLTALGIDVSNTVMAEFLL